MLRWTLVAVCLLLVGCGGDDKNTSITNRPCVWRIEANGYVWRTEHYTYSENRVQFYELGTDKRVRLYGNISITEEYTDERPTWPAGKLK